MKSKISFIALIIFVLTIWVYSETTESSSINIIYTDQQIQEANSNNKSRNVDVVFIVDNTGSMGGEINEVIKNLNDIIENISNLKLLTGKVRYGAIKYQDYEDVYLSEKLDLTNNVNSVISFIQEMKAGGGGDFPEAAAEAFRQASEMTWQENSIKLVFWIADAPPHPSKIDTITGLSDPNSIKSYINNFSSKRNNNNQLTWKGEIIKLQESGIIVHSILVRNDNSTREVMSYVARETNGMVISLNNSSIITPIIVNLVAEGLDRDRISNYIDKILQDKKNEMTLLNLNQKEFFLLNEVNKLALKGLKLKLQILPQKEKYSENIDVQLEFKDLEFFDIKDSLNRIKPCFKYNIFCDYTPEITPKSGIILDGNNSILLEKTNVDIQIMDTLTNVSIVQEFKNTYNKDFNGEYIFPLPLDSSVHEFFADINGKRLFGRVFTKEKANKLYQLAIESGNQAFLLSQENSNIYKVSLGNIPANSSVKISFKFSYILSDNFGKYQVIFPINAFPDEKSTNCNISCTIKSSNNEIVDLTSIGTTSDVIQNKASIQYSGLLNKDFNIEYSLKKIVNKENKIHISFFKNLEYSEKFLGIKDNFSNTNEYPFYALRGEFVNGNNKLINCPDFYIFVDSSASISLNNEQKDKAINEIIANLKQINNCSSNIKIVSFDSKCKVIKEGILNQLSSNKIIISNNTPGSYLIPCLNEINFNSEKIRVIVISDFFISDDYELINLFEQSYVNLKNIKLGLIGIGNRINRDLKKRLSLSTKVKFLEILSSSNVSSFNLTKWLNDLLIEEKNLSFNIQNKSDKRIFEGKNLFSNEIIICNNDAFNSDEFVISCLIDRNTYSINDIKEFKFYLNDKQIEIKEVVENNNDNTLDILVARNILTDAERIYDDFANFGKSTSVNYTKKEPTSYSETYTEKYRKSQPTYILKSLIQKIGLSYRLVSKFTSFLAVDDDFIKKNEKILNEEDKNEAEFVGNTNSTIIPESVTPSQVSVEVPLKDESLTKSDSTTKYASPSSMSYESLAVGGAEVLMDTFSSIKSITIDLLILLSLFIMLFL